MQVLKNKKIKKNRVQHLGELLDQKTCKETTRQSPVLHSQSPIQDQFFTESFTSSLPNIYFSTFNQNSDQNYPIEDYMTKFHLNYFRYSCYEDNFNSDDIEEEDQQLNSKPNPRKNINQINMQYCKTFDIIDPQENCEKGLTSITFESHIQIKYYDKESAPSQLQSAPDFVNPMREESSKNLWFR